jgi:hypothetical protein
MKRANHTSLKCDHQVQRPISSSYRHHLPKSFFARNRDIVDETDILIAIPATKKKTGGTCTPSTIHASRRNAEYVFILMVQSASERLPALIGDRKVACQSSVLIWHEGLNQTSESCQLLCTIQCNPEIQTITASTERPRTCACRNCTQRC